MNINFTQTNNQSQNFKAVNIIQIPKKVFDNPDNFKACSESFGKALDVATGDKLTGVFGNLVALFSTKHHKTTYQLEAASCEAANRLKDKYKMDYSLSWLRQNTGLPIKDEIEKDFHSFYVFTKEHKAFYVDAIKKSIKMLTKCVREGVSKYSGNENLAAIYVNIKANTALDEAIDKMTSEAPVKKFRLNNLDEIKNIVKDLDI